MFIYRKQLKISPKKSLKVIPIGDVQGTEELPRLDALVRWCLEQEKAGHTVRLLTCGDHFETYSPSERAKKAGANFHETTLEMINNQIRAQADDFIQRLMPLKGRIMTVLSGHHWENIKVGRRVLNSDEYIAESLGAEYAGDGISILDLLINGYPFRIMAMHGYGSSRTGGAKLNKRLRMRDVFLNANVYFQAHDNAKIVDVEEPLFLDNGKVKYLRQIFSGIGSHQIAYHLDKLETSYVERLGLPPASVGAVVLTVTVVAEEKRLDYLVSS